MKKYILLFAVIAISIDVMAVPARRVFADYPSADGGTVELTLAGDEYAHWYEDAIGTVYVAGEDGTFAPATTSREQMFSRRRLSPKYNSAEARRARMEVGVKPNLAPKGIVILVNFKDSEMKSTHTQATFDELCNSANCTVNAYGNTYYPSAAEYFNSQSDGKYRPQFDVFGPVTLSKNCAYYGENDAEDNDMYATDAVIEACILANQQYPELNFADYDSDKDKYVDFVYVIYAGQGEAAGGSSTTIWPHNWEIIYAVYPFNEAGQYDPNGERMSCCYTEDDIYIDGVYLNNYAMSSELMGSELGGIGTLCHEFGHVIGLPDFYDTEYNTNYMKRLTPNEWNIMDGGSYNGDGHCPPNYDPWEKYFMGWITPENLGDNPQKLTLAANGTQGYKAYQINAAGVQEAATMEGLNYYIENRQQQGWDTYVPASGMLIWKVDFKADAWINNAPNNTANAPLYTLVIPSGTKIGASYGTENVWPYGNKTSWEGVTGKPLKNITRNGDKIELVYIDESAPVDPFELKWMAQGELFATTTSTGKIVLPDTDPASCSNGKVFVGWCRTADYENVTNPPTFVEAGQSAAEGDIFYAVYAAKLSEGGEPATTKYAFTSKSWDDPTNSWTSQKDGFQYSNTNSGVQITSSADYNGAGATTKQTFAGVSKVSVTYCTNSKNGAGTIDVMVGNDSQPLNVTKTGGTNLRDLEYTFNNAGGHVAFVVNCTTNSIYINSVTITAVSSASYSGYTTDCSDVTALPDNTVDHPAACKVVRDGQVLIQRGNEVFNLLGVRL